MKSIPTEFFTNNRQKLTNSLDKPGLIIVPGNGLLQSRSDTSYPFKQDSNFFYLTGINEPNATLVIDMRNSKQWVQLPIKSDVNLIFDGSTDKSLLINNSGINEIIDDQEGWRRIDRALESNVLVYSPEAQRPYIKQANFYTNPHRLTIINKLKRRKKVNLVDIRSTLARLRQIKHNIEIEQIKTAVNITKSTLDSILPIAIDYKSEAALEGAIFAEFRKHGASGHAYEPIVASGSNACILHYIDNYQQFTRGELLLVDVGAEVNNYAADISRTIALGKNCDNRRKNVIDAVELVQQGAINYLKAGKSWLGYIDHCNELMANQLLRLKLVTSIRDTDGLRRYFPHSISHYLGLDVHDVGSYKDDFQENMVITVEPGIYIPEEGIGVRIEDDIVVTKSGAKII